MELMTAQVDTSHPAKLEQGAGDASYKFVQSFKDFNGFDRFCHLEFGVS